MFSLNIKAQERSGFWQGNTLLALVFTATVSIRSLTYLVRLKEQHLRHAFVGIYLCRQRRGIGELQCYMAFPLGLERRHIDDDSAACISRLAQAYGQYIPGYLEIFNRTRKRKGVRWNDANITGEIDKTVLGEILGVDHRRIDIGKYLKMV